MGQYGRDRAVVTGGAGFIGSHLCDYLLQRNYEVLCVDNFYTGTKRTILSLLEHPYFELIRHDVTFPLYLEADVIYNLACPASPVHYQRDPVQTVKTSVHGAINLLGLAKRLQIPIFQASTSEVYGDPEQHPQTEDYWGNVNLRGPRACYDEGKRCAETLFFDYHRQYQLSIKVARIFNTYGPAMHPEDGRVISNFILAALQNKPLTIFGDGTQTRAFCYITDLLRGIEQFMATPKSITGPINFGNPGEISIQALAELIRTLTNSRSPIHFHDAPQTDPSRRNPDIRKAQHLLQWEPTVSLQEGLQYTIQYFDTVLSKWHSNRGG